MNVVVKDKKWKNFVCEKLKTVDDLTGIKNTYVYM